MTDKNEKNIDNKTGNVKKTTPQSHSETTNYGKIPHTCPVCEGRGKVAHNFYKKDKEEEFYPRSMRKPQCRSCSGAGVVWESST